MIWESLHNRILVFHPIGSCPRGVPRPGSALVGAVVAIRPLPPTQKGSIPNAAITVQGRSGKTAEIDFVETYARPFDTWQEAINASKL